MYDKLLRETNLVLLVNLKTSFLCFTPITTCYIILIISSLFSPISLVDIL